MGVLTMLSFVYWGPHGGRATYPDSQPGIGKRLAGIDVDQAEIEVEVNALLFLMDIATMKFTIPIVKTEDCA
jgi:hypothetical protein